MTTATHLFRPKRAKRRVLSAMVRLAEGGSIVHASQREIAEAADCCHKTVAHAMVEFAARGEIDVISRGRGGRPARYRIAACAVRDPVRRGRP